MPATKWTTRIVATLKKLWRWIWKTYRKEIMAFIEHHIDEWTESAALELKNRFAMHPDLVDRAMARILADQIDVRTEQGALAAKAIVNRYLEDLGKE